ncbi:hypothetical protein Psi02_63060 [Planotetraspora silvatica]|uniref:Uncharacterized protein n=1 Tax=Planotetraspora silvatica TaxID=234614 RepID=A0A8J3XPP4_9ACTN|nr:hypothetical protein Psi02_63060 [Planotetraspora silvatica]
MPWCLGDHGVVADARVSDVTPTIDVVLVEILILPGERPRRRNGRKITDQTAAAGADQASRTSITTDDRRVDMSDYFKIFGTSGLSRLEAGSDGAAVGVQHLPVNPAGRAGQELHHLGDVVGRAQPLQR